VRLVFALCAALAAVGCLAAPDAPMATGRVDGPAAAQRVMAALREGLTEHVIWLTLEERGEIERRMGPWLQQQFAVGVPEQTLNTLAGELRARPVREPLAGGYYAGVREEWMLQNVDALKRAIARWVDAYSASPEHSEAIADCASRIAANLGIFLDTGDVRAPTEAREAAVSQFQQELVGAEPGSLWAPILRPVTEAEIEEISELLLLMEPPRWRPDEDYQESAMSIGSAIQHRLWAMQTSQAEPTEEGAELEEQGAERALRAEAEELGPWEERNVQSRLEARRVESRERAARKETMRAYQVTVHPFLFRALFRVRDSIERRTPILP